MNEASGEEDAPPGASGRFNIWPGDGRPPDSGQWQRREQVSRSARGVPIVRNVSVPTLTVFRPAAGATGASVLIAPGGAFHFLAFEHEGFEVARWFARRGVTAFVLKYRVQGTPPDEADMPAFLDDLGHNLPKVDRSTVDPPQAYAPAEEGRRWAEADMARALDYLQDNAADLGILPDRIGMIGFSAGGAGVNVVAAREAARFPAYLAAIYPAWRQPLDLPAGVPPLFLATCDADFAVAPMSTARLYEAWHRAGGSAELHIFAGGIHGFGMTKQGDGSDGWTELLERWLVSLGVLAAGG